MQPRGPSVDTEQALRSLALDRDVRVLRRVALPVARTWPCDGANTLVGAAIDCETTGLDHGADVVIELALRRFRWDEARRIVAIDRPYAWRQDPGRPLDPLITRLTGLTDADLAGQRIDIDKATRLLSECDLIVAHNAGFDSRFVEATLPAAKGLAWGCTVEGVPWADLGFEGRSLAWLLAQCGWFYRAHRAGDDVDALLELLRHQLDDGATVLSHVVQHAEAEGWLVSAEGAHFDRRVELKGRGYRFDGLRKVWRREIPYEDMPCERGWLHDHVYAREHRPRAAGPTVERVDARNRYRLN